MQLIWCNFFWQWCEHLVFLDAWQSLFTLHRVLLREDRTFFAVSYRPHLSTCSQCKSESCRYSHISKCQEATSYRRAYPNGFWDYKDRDKQGIHPDALDINRWDRLWVITPKKSCNMHDVVVSISCIILKGSSVCWWMHSIKKYNEAEEGWQTECVLQKWKRVNAWFRPWNEKMSHSVVLQYRWQCLCLFVSIVVTLGMLKKNVMGLCMSHTDYSKNYTEQAH